MRNCRKPTKEIEKDTGIHFGIVEKHQFAAIQIQGKDGSVSPLGVDASDKIWAFLNTQKLVDNKARCKTLYMKN